MACHERIFYSYKSAHEALKDENDDTVLLQEELADRRSTNGEVPQSIRRYIVLGKSEWAELRRKEHGRTLHIVNFAGGEERFAVPYFDIDGEVKNGPDRDAAYCEAKDELWRLIGSLLEVSSTVFGGTSTVANCCDMSRDNRISCHIVLRGPAVPKLAAQEIAVILAAATVMETGGGPFKYIQPDFCIYRTSGSLRAVGSVTSCGKKTKTQTHRSRLIVCDDGDVEEQVTSVDGADPADMDPVWGTRVTADPTPEVIEALDGCRSTIFGDTVSQDIQRAVTRLAPAAGGVMAARGTSNRRMSVTASRVVATVRVTPVAVACSGFDPDTMCMGAVVTMIRRCIQEMAGKGAGAMSTGPVVWGVLVLPSGRPVFTHLIVKCGSSFNYCFAKKDSHTNGRAPTIKVDTTTGAIRSICAFGNTCASSRCVFLPVTSNVIEKMESAMKSMNTGTVVFPSGDCAPPENDDVMNEAAICRQLSRTISFRLVQERIRIRSTGGGMVRVNGSTESQMAYVSLSVGPRDDPDASDAARARVATAIRRQTAYVTIRKKRSLGDDLEVMGDSLEAQLIECFDVLIGTGFNRGGVVLVDEGIRGLLPEMQAITDQMDVLRVVELPMSQSLSWTTDEVPMRGGSIALVLECELARYHSVASHMDGTRVDVAICPAAFVQCLGLPSGADDTIGNVVVVCMQKSLCELPPSLGNGVTLTRVYIHEKDNEHTVTTSLQAIAARKRKRKREGTPNVHVIVWDPAAFAPTCLQMLIRVVATTVIGESDGPRFSLLYPGYASQSCDLATMILLHSNYTLHTADVGPPPCARVEIPCRDNDGTTRSAMVTTNTTRDTSAHMRAEINAVLDDNKKTAASAVIANFLTDPDDALFTLHTLGVVELQDYTLGRQWDAFQPVKYAVVPPGHSPVTGSIIPKCVLASAAGIWKPRRSVLHAAKKKDHSLQIWVTNAKCAAYYLCEILWDILLSPTWFAKVVIMLPEPRNVNSPRIWPHPNPGAPLAIRGVMNTFR